MRKKKLVSLFLAASLAVTGVFSGNAGFAAADGETGESKGMVTAYVAVQGHNAEGTKANIPKRAVYLESGASAADAVEQVLDAAKETKTIDTYMMSDSTTYGKRLDSINGMGTEQVGDDWLYWSFLINGQYSQYGLGNYVLTDNDKISLIYSYDDNSMEADDFKDDTSLNPSEEQAAALVSAAKKQQEVLADAVYQKYFGDGSVPGIEGNTNGLYVAFSLLRAGYKAPDGFYQKVTDKVISQLSDLKTAGKTVYQTTDEKGSPVAAELTEQDFIGSDPSVYDYAEADLAKTVLYLTAAGQDASQAGGYDLIGKLASEEVYEGSKGAYMLAPTVLLAIDSGKYKLPEGKGYITRSKLVNEIADGYDDAIQVAIAWDSADSIAMPLQAVAPYRKDVKEPGAARAPTSELSEEDLNRSEAYCAKGLKYLETMQGRDGSIGNAWTLAQVQAAAGQLGINAVSEADGHDLIKNGKTLFDAAAGYVDADKKTVSDALMSYQPEQLLRGLNAMIRAAGGEKALFDVADGSESLTKSTAAPAGTEAPAATETAPAGTEIPEATETAPAGTEIPEATETAPAGTEIPAATETAPAGTEIPAATETVPAGTEAAPAGTVPATDAALAATASVIGTATQPPASIEPKMIKISKITLKKGSKKVKGTLNVKKARVTVTVKRGSKRVELKTVISSKSFTATLTKAKSKKLIKGKKTEVQMKKNEVFLKKDKVIIQVEKNGYKTLKKTYKV